MNNDQQRDRDSEERLVARRNKEREDAAYIRAVAKVLDEAESQGRQVKVLSREDLKGKQR